MDFVKTKGIQTAISPITECLEQMVQLYEKTVEVGYTFDCKVLLDSLCLPLDHVLEASHSLEEYYNDSIYNARIMKNENLIFNIKNTFPSIQEMMKTKETSATGMKCILDSARDLFDYNLDILLAQDDAEIRIIEKVLDTASEFTFHFEKISSQEEKIKLLTENVKIFPTCFVKLNDRCETLIHPVVVTGIMNCITYIKEYLKDGIVKTEEMLKTSDPSAKEILKASIGTAMFSTQLELIEIKRLLHYTEQYSQRKPLIVNIKDKFDSIKALHLVASKWLKNDDRSKNSSGFKSIEKILRNHQEIMKDFTQEDKSKLKGRLEDREKQMNNLKDLSEQNKLNSSEANKLCAKMESDMTEDLKILSNIVDTVESQSDKFGAQNLKTITDSLHQNPQEFFEDPTKYKILKKNLDDMCIHAHNLIDDFQDYDKIVNKKNEINKLLDEMSKLSKDNTAEGKEKMSKINHECTKKLNELKSELRESLGSAFTSSLVKIDSALSQLSFASILEQGDPIKVAMMSHALDCLSNENKKISQLIDLERSILPNESASSEKLILLNDKFSSFSSMAQMLLKDIKEDKSISPPILNLFQNEITVLSNRIAEAIEDKYQTSQDFQDKLELYAAKINCMKVELKENIAKSDHVKGISTAFEIDKTLPLMCKALENELSYDSQCTVKDSILDILKKIMTCQKSVESHIAKFNSRSNPKGTLESILQVTDSIKDILNNVSIEYAMDKLRQDENLNNSEIFKDLISGFKNNDAKRVGKSIGDMKSALMSISEQSKIKFSEKDYDVEQDIYKNMKINSDIMITKLTGIEKELKGDKIDMEVMSTLGYCALKTRTIMNEAELHGISLSSQQTAAVSAVQESSLVIPEEFSHVRDIIVNPSKSDRIGMAASMLHKEIAKAEVTSDSQNEPTFECAKIVALLFADLAQKFNNNESLALIIPISKKIVVHSAGMLKVLKQALEDCTDKRLKERCRISMEKIESLSAQVKILCAVKAADKDFQSGTLSVTDDAIMAASENLMAAVQDAVSAVASAKLRKMKK